jgi:hypothetical protein
VGRGPTHLVHSFDLEFIAIHQSDRVIAVHANRQRPLDLDTHLAKTRVRAIFSGSLVASFRLRRKVFHEKLGWKKNEPLPSKRNSLGKMAHLFRLGSTKS